MHLTLSSTAVFPPPLPILLLLSPFQFASATLPLLFCTHTLSLYLSLLHCTHILPPPPPPPLPFALFPLSVPLTPAEISILLVTTSRSRFRSQAQAATLSRRFVVCSLHANMPAEEGGKRRGGRERETENEAQTSQISPAVAKQFNHIAQKFEVSYKNKIHTHMLASACVCVCRALSLSLSRICFVLMSFFVFARIVAGVARCPGSLAQKPLFPGRNRRDISSYPLPLYPLQASPGKPISTQCNPFPVCFIQVEVGHWSCV